MKSRRNYLFCIKYTRISPKITPLFEGGFNRINSILKKELVLRRVFNKIC